MNGSGLAFTSQSNSGLATKSTAAMYIRSSVSEPVVTTVCHNIQMQQTLLTDFAWIPDFSLEEHYI